MSNTVERHPLDGNREVSFQRFEEHVVIAIYEHGGLESRLYAYNDEAVLLRDFLNRHFPEGGSNA